jgi:hypothetical protein
MTTEIVQSGGGLVHIMLKLFGVTITLFQVEQSKGLS